MSSGLEVLSDVDGWSELDHALLSTSGRQVDEGRQARQARVEKVAWTKEKKDREF